MTRSRTLASILGTVAAIAFAGSVAAHTAVPKCGGTLTLDRGSRTADITRTDTNPDQLVWDDVPGSGTYAVLPGVFRVDWSDGFVIRHLEVKACPAPSPSPSSQPTPSPSPKPTPEASSSPPSSPTPEATPSRSPSATPTASTTSRPTLPPTEPAPLPATPPIPPSPAPLLALLAGIAGFGLVMRRVAR